MRGSPTLCLEAGGPSEMSSHLHGTTGLEQAACQKDHPESRNLRSPTSKGLQDPARCPTENGARTLGGGGGKLRSVLKEGLTSQRATVPQWALPSCHPHPGHWWGPLVPLSSSKWQFLQSTAYISST